MEYHFSEDAAKSNSRTALIQSRKHLISKTETQPCSLCLMLTRNRFCQPLVVPIRRAFILELLLRERAVSKTELMNTLMPASVHDHLPLPPHSPTPPHIKTYTHSGKLISVYW